MESEDEKSKTKAEASEMKPKAAEDEAEIARRWKTVAEVVGKSLQRPTLRNKRLYLKVRNIKSCPQLRDARLRKGCLKPNLWLHDNGK